MLCLLPLNNDGGKRRNPDYKWFYEHEDKLLKRYLSDLHLDAPPGSLAEYLAKVVTPTLERQKREGAVALKFEAAYLRPLDFEPAAEKDAARVYEQYVRGGEPPEAEYRTLQNFLFFYIAREAGRLGLAVHFHSIPGCGDYLHGARGEPAADGGGYQRSVASQDEFRDHSWRLAVHEGGCRVVSAPQRLRGFLPTRPALYPRALSEVMRDWLEWYPGEDSVRHRRIHRSAGTRLGAGRVAGGTNGAARIGRGADGDDE